MRSGRPRTHRAPLTHSTRSEDTYVTYAVVYPAAMIGKILLTQLIARLGGSDMVGSLPGGSGAQTTPAGGVG
jgi:hypothetical protein